MWNEFKAFAARGSVIDLAVGIIIGVAFTTVVNSLVNDILMPPIGEIVGGVDFTDLFINLSGGSYDSLAEAQAAGAATINYGLFINAVINFLIVALAVFFLIKAVNRFLIRQEEVVEETAEEVVDSQERLIETLDKLNTTLESMQPGS
jgi:large conductance mechanosensitive channel